MPIASCNCMVSCVTVQDILCVLWHEDYISLLHWPQAWSQDLLNSVNCEQKGHMQLPSDIFGAITQSAFSFPSVS